MRWRTLLVMMLLLLVPVLSGPTTAAERSAAAGSARGFDNYWPYDGNGGTDAQHYNVNVVYDFATGTLAGRTVVTMRAIEDLTSVYLDLLLPVSGAKVDGRTARFTRSTGHEVRVALPKAVASGDVFRVELTYKGRPATYSYAGESNWLADRHEVVAMNQPHMAPWWFPSNDHPSDKARYDIRVTVPRAKRVASNGTYVARVANGDRATTHWQMKDPMATYLAFFAAGDFVLETGRSGHGIRYYNFVSSRLPSGERADALRMLRRTAGMTDWLENWLGPYPFTSTGGVVTSLDVGFALENQTRPTYGSWIYPGVMVHELAHQWFGDSVSVRRWRDIWLNEGFATFAEVAYEVPRGGISVNTWLHRAYDDLCRQSGSEFWTLDLRNPGRDEIFAEAVYNRGAMVLAALQGRIGLTDMNTLLRTWVADHRDGNVTSAQFEALAQNVSGENLVGFFDAWLGGGVPIGNAANGLDHPCPPA